MEMENQNFNIIF